MAKSSTSFKPGQCGNRGGRPKVVAAVRELAQKHTTEAMAVLVSIMKDKKQTGAARAAAAIAVLDRGHGRPMTNVTVTGDAALPIPLIVVSMADPRVANRLQSEAKPPTEN
jgi:hypothetical protein